MKEFLRYFSLLIVLSIVLSGGLSCSDSRSQNVPIAGGTPVPDADGNSKDSNSAGGENPAGEKVSVGKSEDYPPLPSSIAQADVKNLDGTTFKIADRQGKVLLLNLWATWCGPCRAEMPALVEMHAKYDGRFEVLGLNTDDESREMIDKFAEEMKLNYPLVWADTALQNELVRFSKFGGIPQSFLVDRRGHLRAVFKGGSPREVAKMRAYVDGVVNEQ